MTRHNLRTELGMIRVKLDQAAECTENWHNTLHEWLMTTARRIDKALEMLPPYIPGELDSNGRVIPKPAGPPEIASVTAQSESE